MARPEDLTRGAVIRGILLNLEKCLVREAV
jgi:hypothetical protein